MNTPKSPRPILTFVAVVSAAFLVFLVGYQSGKPGWLKPVTYPKPYQKYILADPDPLIQNIVIFGDGHQRIRVRLGNRDDFENALNDQAKVSWRSDLNITKDLNHRGLVFDEKTATVTGAETFSSGLVLLQKNANSTPCTQHVTQKAAFFNKADLDKVLTYLDTP